MAVKNIKLKKFRRFVDLKVENIPESAKLVILTGPNGSGKSSLFDAMLVKYRSMAGYGWNGDKEYYNRQGEGDDGYLERISIELHGGAKLERGRLYCRSAYRHDPEFRSRTLSNHGPMLDNFNLNRLIESDATVRVNYERLASQAMEGLFVSESEATTVGAYRDKFIGKIRDPMHRLFPDLELVGIGNPLSDGTFQFNKGDAKGFDYKNLSGGEKAAFDLVLDVVVKRESYQEAIYCIDEPETHMNTRVQGALLEELVNLIPDKSQLWVASHSIGMMRKARALYDAAPDTVAFLDFDGHDFDKETVIEPSVPNRVFWQKVMHIALDDLSALIAPKEVVICEGNPDKAQGGKNIEHDARLYGAIFSEEFPDTSFISAGSSRQVSGDYIALATALPKVASGISVRRLIDRDDHDSEAVAEFTAEGVTVLAKRNIESYLYDDEVLEALCASLGQAEAIDELLRAKADALEDSVRRHNPIDDLKKVAGVIHQAAKRILRAKLGNDVLQFERGFLAPKIRRGTVVYDDLKFHIFGNRV